MPRTPLNITDHAVLRYLERVQGVDVRAVRRAIEAKVRIAEGEHLVNSVLSGGFRYVIEGGNVVTVVAPHQDKIGKRKCKKRGRS